MRGWRGRSEATPVLSAAQTRVCFCFVSDVLCVFSGPVSKPNTRYGLRNGPQDLTPALPMTKESRTDDLHAPHTSLVPAVPSPSPPAFLRLWPQGCCRCKAPLLCVTLHLSGTHPLGSLTPRWTSTGPPTPCARQEPSRSDHHRAARPRELKVPTAPPTPATSRCRGAGSGRQAKPQLYHPGLKTREAAGALYFTHRLRALDGTGEQERDTPRHRG